ncbi:hypothetical protein FPOA_03706 [Fusarium poae]|uniref:Heterokaryon incompatibility domain-containing protein n=1 Tax=Fusarium poae TaxID=36050 RepID=A0A1B8ARG8_FUSPO|nr:hypothetical protein FPOA_03706 [Fusarium poae]
MPSVPQPQHSYQRTDSGGSGDSEKTLIGKLQHPETGLTLESTDTLRPGQKWQTSWETEKPDLAQSHKTIQPTEAKTSHLLEEDQPESNEPMSPNKPHPAYESPPPPRDDVVLQYRALLRNEIRLLTIEDIDVVDDSTNPTSGPPIVCSLEHVCLTGSEDLPEHAFKGSEGTWPELPTHQDFAPLFKAGRDIHAEEEKNTASTGTSSSDEHHLPWRYPWGDFIALSYVWGHPKRKEGEPPYTVVINGCSFEVTPNLYHALSQLRKSYRIRQGFKLWVDAICINQSDTDERGQQVGRMRDIYQAAWHVAVWIGPSDEHSRLAFLALHWLSRESKREKPMEDFYRETFSLDLSPLVVIWPTYESPMKKIVYETLFHFFTRPYWRRMWIVQEIAMGNPDTPVICGDNCISWKDLQGAVSLIAADEARFGRDVVGSVKPQLLSGWAFEIGRDRVVEEREWAPERMWKVPETITHLQKHQASNSRGDWRMLVQALNIVRDSLVTEERDRVYGVLGLKAITDSLVWDKTPDYTMSLDQLYVDFTLSFVATGNLSILRLVSRYAGPRRTVSKTVSDLRPMLRRQYTAPIALWATRSKVNCPTAGTLCSHDIPSWTVCWTCAPAPTAHLGGVYQADASLGQPVPLFPRDKTKLRVRGVFIDKITSLSSSHHDEADIRYPLNSDDPQINVYGDIAATRDAFWRTIVGDTTDQGGIKAPDHYSWLLNNQVWEEGVSGIYTYDFALHRFMQRNRNLRICGYSLEELLLGRNKLISRLRLSMGKSYNLTVSQREALSWATNAMAWRRVFGTLKGRMGLGTCAAEFGDRIAILRGCNTPLILRKARDGWELVGECYVHGVMYGEISSEEHKLEDITIY